MSMKIPYVIDEDNNKDLSDNARIGKQAIA
jgi:hypothetical protein